MFVSRPRIDDGGRRFIESCEMFFLATADADGQPKCSYKGGDPGFVRVLDPTHLAFPSYDGNGMFLSLGNVHQNPKVGMLFIDFVGGNRLRVNGHASVDEADPLTASWPGAQLTVRVAVTQVFPNCPRYIHRMERVEASPFVPRDGCATPVPDWKRTDWARPVLPAGDPALED
jgi:predicted pyridoxine 5'-phosphate oxidase superfamily flavin-nucleotide-binding protein